MRVAAVALIVVVIIEPAVRGQTVGDFPPINVSAPVLIQSTANLVNKATNSTTIVSYFSTGIYYFSSDKYFLVTARHALFKETGNERLSDTFTLTSEPTSLSVSGHDILEVNLERLLAEAKVYQDSTDDIVAVQVGVNASTAPVDDNHPPLFKAIDGTNFREIAPEAIKLFRESDVAMPSEYFVGNTVFVGGYPKSIGLQEKPQYDWNRPLFSAGIVAGVNKFNSNIIVSANVFPGNSGGPVWEVVSDAAGGRKLKLIGIVTEFIPFLENHLPGRDAMEAPAELNSGYAVVAPINNILPMLKGK